MYAGGKGVQWQNGKSSSKGTKRTYNDNSGFDAKRAAIKCYACNGWGHVSSECPTLKSQKGTGKSGKDDKDD